MANVMPLPVEQDADRTISRAVKGFSGARGYSRDTVAHAIGATPRTFARRLARGGWTAVEVARLADFFGCTVADLYDGHMSVNPPPSTGAPGGIRTPKPSDP